MRLLLTLVLITVTVVLLCAAHGPFNKGGDKSRKGKAHRHKHQSITINKWTNNTIPYAFACDYDGNKALVEEVMCSIAKRTCLRFVENDTIVNRLNFVNNNGVCDSSVGMVGGAQDVFLGKGCDDTFGSIMRQLLHALGFYRTELRYDRETALNMNIVKGNDYCDSLDIMGDEQSIAELCPYDFGSVLHSPITNCSNGEPAWLPIRGEYKDTVGSGIISFYDYEQINKMYGCNDLCSEESSAVCKNGGTPNPNDCSHCNCPTGYGAEHCDDSVGDLYDAVEDEDWKNITISIRQNAPGMLLTGTNYKAVWINHPDDTKVEVQLLSMPDVEYTQGCLKAGIEFKIGEDVANTGPRFCKDEVGEILETSNNPFAVIAHLYQPGEQQFTFQYRLKS